jgi:hypothetical protein
MLEIDSLGARPCLAIGRRAVLRVGVLTPLALPGRAAGLALRGTRGRRPPQEGAGRWFRAVSRAGERLRRMAELRARGLSYAEVGRRLGASTATSR